jgi:hypothetical protein
LFGSFVPGGSFNIRINSGPNLIKSTPREKNTFHRGATFWEFLNQQI